MSVADARTRDGDSAFDALARTLEREGPDAAIGRLLELLGGGDDPRALLDALLLRARHELGLPLIAPGSLAELPEPTRTRYEERYIEALRQVGRSRLDAGDLLGAWPYFRAIGEPEPVAEALEAVDPSTTDGQVLGQLMELALQHGANPRRGFELILESYGPCSAITAFEHLPPDEATRIPCVDRLTRHLHDQLRESLAAEIERTGLPRPPALMSIPELLEGRDWLFEDEGYHIDTSHLASVVRMSPLLRDPSTIRLAIELTDYGRRLGDRLRYEGEAPFDRLFEDHAAYLGALVGEGVDEAIARFRSKLPEPAPDGDLSRSMPAQVLIRLLDRIGRGPEAIPIAAAYLSGAPEGALICPGLARLCQQAGRPDLLARHARDGGDLVCFAAAILQG